MTSFDKLADALADYEQARVSQTAQTTERLDSLGDGLSGVIQAIQTLNDVQNGLIARVAALESLPVPEPSPIPAPAPPEPVPTPEPDPDSEPPTAQKPIRTQLGLGPFAWWGGVDPVINELLLYAWDQVAGERVRQSKLKFDALLAEGAFDLETGRFVRVPEGVGSLRVGFFRSGYKAGAPAGYHSSEYIIEWDGDADFSVRSRKRATLKPRGARKVLVTFEPDDYSEAALLLARIGAGGVSNIRVYDARYEQNVARGEIFKPEYVERIRHYDIIRPMAPAGVPGDRTTSVFQIQAGRRQYLAGVPEPRNEYRGGLPLSWQVELAKAADAELWVNTPPFLGAPQGFDAERFRSLGDKQKIALAGEAAPAFLRSSALFEYAQYLDETLTEKGYPLFRPVYACVGNENWNTAPAFRPATFFFKGVGLYLSGKEHERYGFGYRLAQFADALFKVNPDRNWVIPLETHVQSAWKTKNALEGADAYFATMNDAARVDFLKARFAVSPTNYFQGFFRPDLSSPESNPYGVTVTDGEYIEALEEYYEALIADYNADPDAAFKRGVEHILNGPSQNSWAARLREIREHVDELVKWGGGGALETPLCFYEGGSHDDVNERRFPEHADDLRAIKEHWRADGHGAAITLQMAWDVAAEFPGAVLSNYQEQGRPAIGAPWVENRPGEVTPVNKAWKQISAGAF